MGTYVIGALSAERMGQQSALQNQMAQAGQGIAANPAKFTFFAAFDGTNNDRTKVPNGRFQTNAANLVDQAATAGTKSGYFRGVGTGGEMGGLKEKGSGLPSCMLDNPRLTSTHGQTVAH